MGVVDTISGLTEFPGRGAGTDAERRGALWLQSQLESAGREARIEPFWCRPNWALAQAWHVALALAGSLVSVSEPQIGGAMIVAALLSIVADSVFGVSPGRLLTREHASQNVVSLAPDGESRLRLIVTANYDAGRTGLVQRERVRGIVAGLRRTVGRASPGWVGWLAIAVGALLVTAVLRLGDRHSTVIGVVQLGPTVALVLAFAALLELGSSEYGPAAGDNGSGVAVALAVVRALDVAPPRNLVVEVVLGGAGDPWGIGLRRHLRSRRRQLRRPSTVVLGIAPCSSGSPRWWMSDGPLVALRYLPRLHRVAASVAAAESHLEARPVRGRGATPAFQGRLFGRPAIAIGCLDERDLVPRSHTLADTPDQVDARAADSAVAFVLALVDAIDADLARTPAPPVPAAG